MDGVVVSLEASLGTKIRYYSEHDSAGIDPAGVGLTLSDTLSNATGHGRMAQAASEPAFESHQPEGGKALPLGLSPYTHRYQTPLIVNQLGTTVVHAVAIKDGRQSEPVRLQRCAYRGTAASRSRPWDRRRGQVQHAPARRSE
mmetsp:Transcript_6851/g.16380  ORF Transcript_6851/g.16380 Transcript_6851/m.16380 type:complete len:143 (-) Transcript_6851:977-1405(-)